MSRDSELLDENVQQTENTPDVGEQIDAMSVEQNEGVAINEQPDEGEQINVVPQEAEALEEEKVDDTAVVEQTDEEAITVQADEGIEGVTPDYRAAKDEDELLQQLVDHTARGVNESEQTQDDAVETIGISEDTEGEGTKNTVVDEGVTPGELETYDERLEHRQGPANEEKSAEVARQLEQRYTTDEAPAYRQENDADALTMLEQRLAQEAEAKRAAEEAAAQAQQQGQTRQAPVTPVVAVVIENEVPAGTVDVPDSPVGQSKETEAAVGQTQEEAPPSVAAKKPRDFKADNLDRAFRVWSLLTGWPLFLAHVFLVFALVGASVVGMSFASVGRLTLSPFAYDAVIALVGELTTDFSVSLLLANLVPLLTLVVYAIGTVLATVTLIWSFIRVLGLCTRADTQTRQARYTALYRGVIHSYSYILYPLLGVLLWGERPGQLGIIALVVFGVLYLAYVWIYSWFGNADNEANKLEKGEFWTDALRRTLVLGVSVLALYSVLSGWLAQLMASVQMFLVNISDNGIAGYVGYYLDLARPLAMAVLCFLICKRLRRVLRTYGGDFIPYGRRRADKVAYREDKAVYKISSGWARTLVVLVVFALLDCVRVATLYGSASIGPLITSTWLLPLGAGIVCVLLVSTGGKPRPKVKKRKKRKKRSKKMRKVPVPVVGENAASRQKEVEQPAQEALKQEQAAPVEETVVGTATDADVGTVNEEETEEDEYYEEDVPTDVSGTSPKNTAASTDDDDDDDDDDDTPIATRRTFSKGS